MDCSMDRRTQNSSRWIGAGMLIILIAGGVLTYWTILSINRQMRANLLGEAQLY